ncbi:SIP domain-containing protein [Archangium violaceum]|uniref:siderophore-interacting protein n=1 Tax=Archangium violaceum TaxID=83451 RepID=UPI002B2ADEA9|nr:SIP domain-containing protein [Archangium gephyra]
MNVLGPGGNFGLQEAKRHVFLGDETALGVFACMARAARGEVVGAVEVDAGNEAWPAAAGLELPAVARNGARGDSLLHWLRANKPSVTSDTCFYLVGHTGSIVRLRAELLEAGWSKRSIRTKPYWADGKRGL